MNEEQGSKLAGFASLLWEESKKQNLISVKNFEELLWKHILDSLAPLGEGDFLFKKSVLDLGSGGGFPGVPLSILTLHKEFYLLEANKKKASFLEEVVKSLSLENVTVLPVRAEEAARGNCREKFDLVVCRAVASLPVLVELALPLINKNGFFWAYKGPGVKEEIELCNKALKLCGGKVSSLQELPFPEESGISKRYLIEIYKKHGTPEKYPRRTGMPQKRPCI